MAGVRGIDVSAWQRQIDWPAVAGAGFRFAYVKASEGLTYKSPTLGEQWEGAGEAGLLRGGYHFFHPAKSPGAQAELFCRLLDRLPFGDLPPALDVEAFKGTKELTADVIVARAIECLEAIERLYGCVPLIYTGPSFWRYKLSRTERGEELHRWPVWWASYGDEPKPCPWPETPAGTSWTIWQQSGTASVPGVAGKCDVNLFAGDEAQLLALADREPRA